MIDVGFRARRRGGRLQCGEVSLRVVVRRGAKGTEASARFRGGALELSATFSPSASHPGVELVVDLRGHAVVPRFLPHLTPALGNVMADSVLRAPAVVLEIDGVVVTFVLDADDLAAIALKKPLRTWVDYDHEAQQLTIAIGGHEAVGHVFYRRAAIDPGVASARLRVGVSAVVQEPTTASGRPLAFAARTLWQRWGRRGVAFDRRREGDLRALSRRVARWAFDPQGWGETVWQDVSAIAGRPAGAPVFIVDVAQHPSVPKAERRWREPRSLWNQAWFSTQRCANGLFQFAERTGDMELEERARQMTEVALMAPSDGGFFPSVLIAEGPDEDPWSRHRWTNSDRRPASVDGGAFHLVDMAFTCQMLAEWAHLTGDARGRSRVDALLDAALPLQRESGAFPAWIRADRTCATELADSAESAVMAALLLRESQGDRARVDAAKRTLAFLDGVVRDSRWEDFETYWSCAPWGLEHLGERVPRNGVYKQNTLAMFWTADAFLAAFEALGDARYLAIARRVVDELSLYQAVWNPPFLPARALGGFGVMNADSEWNDARQSLFAPLYFAMFDATGERAYLERGRAALVASFSMMFAPENPALYGAYRERFPFFGDESHGFMMENQGHGAGHPIGTFTIYSWGNGSALASYAKLAHRLEGAK